MKNYFYIFLSFIFAGLLPHSAKAFIIMDAGTKIEDVVEMTIELVKTKSEEIIKKEADQRDQKLGEMGRSAHKYYDTLFRHLRQKRKLNFLDVPSFLKGAVNSVDEAEKVVMAQYIPFYDKNDMNHAKLQERKNTEAKQTLATDLYAKSYTLRNYLAKERLDPAPIPQPENTRELIETGRAYTEKTIQRFNDVLMMEATLLDYENSQEMMSADPIRLDTAMEKEETSGTAGAGQ